MIVTSLIIQDWHNGSLHGTFHVVESKDNPKLIFSVDCWADVPEDDRASFGGINTAKEHTPENFRKRIQDLEKKRALLVEMVDAWSKTR